MDVRVGGKGGKVFEFVFEVEFVGEWGRVVVGVVKRGGVGGGWGLGFGGKIFLGGEGGLEGVGGWFEWRG